MNPPAPRGPRIGPATGEEVAAAIERAGTGNPLLGIGSGTGLPAHRLCATRSTAAADLVDAVAGWLAHPERRVAASLVVLGYAARLVGPTLAVLLRDDILLDARPHQVHYTFTPNRGFRLTLPHPTGWHPPGSASGSAWRRAAGGRSNAVSGRRRSCPSAGCRSASVACKRSTTSASWPAPAK